MDKGVPAEIMTVWEGRPGCSDTNGGGFLLS